MERRIYRDTNRRGFILKLTRIRVGLLVIAMRDVCCLAFAHLHFFGRVFRFGHWTLIGTGLCVTQIPIRLSTK